MRMFQVNLNTLDGLSESDRASEIRRLVKEQADIDI